MTLVDSVLLREVFGVAFGFLVFFFRFQCQRGGSRRRFQRECLCVWIAEGELLCLMSLPFLAE